MLVVRSTTIHGGDMRQELDAALCAKYPKMMAQRNLHMTETCMCWGFECGDGWYNIIDSLMGSIQHHIDWKMSQHERAVEHNTIQKAVARQDFALFNEKYGRTTQAYQDAMLDEFLEDELLGKIREVPPMPTQVVLTQVKEKLGSLRFYYDGGHESEYIRGLVSMAEQMSTVICETCGSPGKHRGGGWVRTLCDKHEEQHQRGECDEIPSTVP